MPIEKSKTVHFGNDIFQIGKTLDYVEERLIWKDLKLSHRLKFYFTGELHLHDAIPPEGCSYKIYMVRDEDNNVFLSYKQGYSESFRKYEGRQK